MPKELREKRVQRFRLSELLYILGRLNVGLDLAEHGKNDMAGRIHASSHRYEEETSQLDFSTEKRQSVAL